LKPAGQNQRLTGKRRQKTLKEQELNNQGRPKNEDELLLKASLDAQRLGKNGPPLNGNQKGKQEENYGNGKAGSALLRRQSLH
jgi:hypothetical protein